MAGMNSSSSGVTLSWRDLSVYAMGSGRRSICKQLVNNGINRAEEKEKEKKEKKDNSFQCAVWRSPVT